MKLQPSRKLWATGLIFLIISGSCTAPVPEEKPAEQGSEPEPAYTPSYKVEEEGVEKSKGQLVYVPVYSDLKYGSRGQIYNLSATLSIRNTSLKNPLAVNKIYYFNNEGNLERSFLEEPVILEPLQSADYFVSQSDMSGGTGANFIVEWESETLVNEPIIESVMIGVAGTQGISFASRGKVIGVQFEGQVQP